MLSRLSTCCMLAAATAIFVIPDKHVEAQAGSGPLARVVDINVNSIAQVQGQPVANATLELNVVGRNILRNVQIPLNFGASPGADGQCDILQLVVGPSKLDVLGLVVELDDCANGPVVVEILAQAEPGNLLGNLVCRVAGLLNSGSDLDGVLASLDQAERTLLLGSLTTVLNSVFDRMLVVGTPTAAHGQGGGTGGGRNSNRCDILNLELDGLLLTVLGLNVQTSAICLDVYAVRGQGNLLGNLLCTLTGLIDGRANPMAQQALVNNILRLLNRIL